MKSQNKWLAAWLALGLALAACRFSDLPVLLTPPAPAVSGEQPYEIVGTFQYTNDIITVYYVEQAVALVDMYGFVQRDQEWEIPLASQTLGFLSLDPESKTGQYTLQLPARPNGQMVDVDNNGKQDRGVQIFAVAYWPNLSGGPYSEGDDRSFGWPTYLASVVTDSENQDEVVGGNLVVWAPDGNQKFPAGFGADKKLFTADDPVAPLPAGYSVVNLDREPFAVTQTPRPSLTLFEPKEAAIKDFSKDSYTAAFEKVFALVRKNYAFNGVPGKEPDWEKVYQQIQPRVAEAERKRDANAFYLAVRDFTWAFRDGHVGLDGGEFAQKDFTEATAGGYGLAIRELDDGRVVVIYVLDNGPAAQAGIKVGAEVTEFNGRAIHEAIAAVRPYALQSSDFAIRYQQTRYLLRARPGTQASVTFINPGEPPRTATLKAVAERQSFGRTSLYYGVDTDPLLPIEYRILEEGRARIGYIAIHSNYDDLNLVIRLFQRALEQFRARQVAGLIIDLRYNSGGAPLGLAGFFYDKEITLGQLEYYSDLSRRFEPEGKPDRILPNVEQYRFDKIAVLVGPACFSACELEAYGFSQVPGMLVVGQYPTAGVEAEVSRGQFLLPEGMSLQVPFGRFVNPDGSLFLEGQGVQPNLKVPVDMGTVLSNEDEVLKAALQAILGRTASGATGGSLPPAAGAPKLASQEEARAAVKAGVPLLEDKAVESYQEADFAAPGTLTYTVSLRPSEQVLWAYVWCTTSQTILDENFQSIKLRFVLNGKDVTSQTASLDTDFNDLRCRVVYTALSDWPQGSHHLIITATLADKINDGMADYPAGDYVLDYTVNVQP